jgi:hypothetical protein
MSCTLLSFSLHFTSLHLTSLHFILFFIFNFFLMISTLLSLRLIYHFPNLFSKTAWFAEERP